LNSLAVMLAAELEVNHEQKAASAFQRMAAFWLD
jgi:hypothetical protein